MQTLLSPGVDIDRMKGQKEEEEEEDDEDEEEILNTFSGNDRPIVNDRTPSLIDQAQQS